MKIALVSSVSVPSVYGGMDRMLEGLTAALREFHETDLIGIPVDETSTEGIVKGYYDFYNLDLSAYDAVITCKGPAYMVNHPIHVVFLSHRIRVFYDLYQPRDANHTRLRRMIQWMDSWALSPSRVPYVYTIGATVSKRLRKWGGIDSQFMHLPSTLPTTPPCKGEYFFSAGRLHEWKRIDLVIRAFRKSKSQTPLHIAGIGPQEDYLRKLAGDDPRIRFLGHISEEALSKAYASALCVVFPPINEDLGLITFEAFNSGKPVITTNDSGEPAEIVEDGKTGFIIPPTESAMAEKFSWIDQHHDVIASMQHDCLDRGKQVTWQEIARTLIEAIERTKAQFSSSKTRGTDERIHLLVTDNQIIDPPIGGGRIRIWELYRNLPDDFITTYLGTHDHPGPLFRDQWLAPNFREIITPLTLLHFQMHEIWRRLTRGDATIDVTIPLLLGRFSPKYKRLLNSITPWADLIICAHPWMYPWLPKGIVPIIYDSQNYEAALKGSLLKHTLAGRWLTKKIRAIEKAAVLESAAVFACSPTDEQAYIHDYGANPEKILMVPNGVNCSRIVPENWEDKKTLRLRLGLPDQPMAVFVGSNYEPNIDALDFITKTLAPKLTQVTFVIIGGVGPMWQERYPHETIPENVRILGFVEEEVMLQYYRAASFGVNPMMRGSGTNIKMLDYMAAGLPIITTDAGARGLSGKPDDQWRQVPLETFVNAVEEFLESPQSAQAMGERARRLAQEAYDWPRIAQKAAEVLRKLNANGAGR